MIASIDTSLIDWSRAQFALTAMYHWLFVPLTLGRYTGHHGDHLLQNR